MQMYTCKKTGKKFTAEEVAARRQERSKRQKRAKLILGGFVMAVILVGAQFFFSPGVSAFNAQFKNMQTVEIRMQPNQTVWEIIETLTPDHNTREVLYAMKSMNEGINLEEAKAYSDVITFYVDETVDLTELTHLRFDSSVK